MPDDPDLYTTKQLADRIGVFPTQIALWQKNGLIAPAGMQGKTHVWDWSVVRRKLIETGRWDEQEEKYRGNKKWEPMAENLRWAERMGLK